MFSIRFLIISLLSVYVTAFSASVSAGIEVTEFDTPEQAQTYKVLVKELRCLVCQNQNLADSNAPLAKDLRDEIREMIKQGKNKQQIVDFMVARYGDFVLYRPPFKAYTLILWLGPFIGLLLAIYILINIIRKRSHNKVATISEAEQKKVDDLLASRSKDDSEN